MKTKSLKGNSLRKNSFSLFRKILSYIAPDILELRSGDISPVLSVKLCDGELQLDAARVNYSFGGLHTLFVKVFQKIELGKYKPEKVLILGYGVGSVGHILRNNYGLQSHITAVELDTVVIELGGRYFNMSKMENFRLYNMDASEYVKSSGEAFDLIIVDVFVESTVPESVRSRGFLEDLSKLMNKDALLIYNYMIHDKISKENFIILENRMQDIFPGMQTLVMNDGGNDNHVFAAQKIADDQAGLDRFL
jgi:spermidine synthase